MQTLVEGWMTDDDGSVSTGPLTFGGPWADVHGLSAATVRTLEEQKWTVEKLRHALRLHQDVAVLLLRRRNVPEAEIDALVQQLGGGGGGGQEQ